MLGECPGRIRPRPVIIRPHVPPRLLFLWSDRGIVSCVEPAKGEVLWQERAGGTFAGSPVCAGGRLYSMSAEGEVVVVKAGRSFELLARNPLGEGTHSTPAIAGGRLYLRTFTRLLAIGGKRRVE